MGDEKIIARSFGREKLACGAFIGCFIMAVNLCTVLNLLKPYLGLPPINYFLVESMEPIIRNLSNFRSDMYEIKGDIRIHGSSSTIFVASSHNQNLSSWTTKPYPQRWVTVFVKVPDFKIKMEAADRIPRCNRNIKDIPAIVFPGRAHADNHFHAFSDLLFPLFLTSHQFKQRVIFLVTYQYSPWMSKYRVILEKLSKYGVYDIDKENEVLCFSRMIVGLKTPINLFIHPSEPESVSMGNFTKLLRSAYSLERESVHDHRLKTGKTSQPRMLIISRKNSRRLMNEHEIDNMARSLGFDVVLKQLPSNLSLVAKLVNSFDVMVGVHGAGLTNLLFLPENALLLQITPYGVDLESKTCFEWAVQCLKLRYLEYKVALNESSLPKKKLNESSLLRKYHFESEVYRDPDVIRKKSYGLFHTVYLDNQDVNLDLDRFRKTLLRALEIVGN